MSFQELFPDRIQEGLRLKNAHNLLVLWAPNILNPYKLAANLRHPIGEVIHTSHKQDKVAMIEGIEYDVVEHMLGKKLVTIDVVALDSYQQELIARLRQIFGRRFYLGHDRDFPQPFSLVRRDFVKSGSGFDKDAHVQGVLNEVRSTQDRQVQIFPFSAFIQTFVTFFSLRKNNFLPSFVVN